MRNPPDLVEGEARYENLTEFELAKVKKDFTFFTKFGEEVELFRREGSTVYLPRAVCPVGEIDYRTEPRALFGETNFIPRNDKQKLFIENGLKALKPDPLGNCGAIISAPTGFGKTACALEIIRRLQKRTLVIVTKQDLVDQWAESIQKFLGIPPKEVGLIQADICEVGKLLTIGMVHSLSKRGRYNKSVYKSFGLIVFDEVHRMAADTFSQAIGNFNAKYRLGLSATPNRVDGKEKVFLSHIGPIAVKELATNMTPKVLWYVTNWECPLVYWGGRVKRLPHTAGKLGKVLGSITTDKSRNRELLRIIEHGYQKGRKIVVFSDRVQHLKTLFDEVNVPSWSKSLYIGEMSKTALKAAQKRDVLFATYGMMSEGTDIPSLDMCVLGTPRSNIVQAVGRVLRTMEGKKRPVVVDFVDIQHSDVLQGYATKRKNWYHSIGAEVKVVRI